MATLGLATARISLGGAYFRVWIEGSGLALELPSCVVREKDTGRVIAFGEDAVGMSGRLPQNVEFIRPFSEDAIYDRDILRALLEYVSMTVQQRLPVWQRPVDFLRYEVAIQPTVHPLHREWLQKTFREAGFWRWRAYDPFLTVAQRVGRRARAAQAVGVLDIGFSSARAAVYLGEESIFSSRKSDLSLQQFCEWVVEEERRRYGIHFSGSVLFDQQWFVQQSGFDEKQNRAVSEPIHKTSFAAAEKRYEQALAAFLDTSLENASPEIRASMQHHGWTVIGGGASLPPVLNVADTFSIPIKMYSNSRYADIRVAE